MNQKKAKAIRKGMKVVQEMHVERESGAQVLNKWNPNHRRYGETNVREKVYKKWKGNDEETGKDVYEDIPYTTRTIVLHPDSGRKTYQRLKGGYKDDLRRGLQG